MRLATTLASLALLGLSLLPAGAQGLRAPPGAVTASLVSDSAAVVPGLPFDVGIRLSMGQGWHVYWRNPGDSGTAPEMAWRLPEGFSTGPVSWPAPERIPEPPMMSYGYEGNVVLVVPVTAPRELPAGATATLSGRLSYLACKDICVPGSADLSLDLPVSDAPVRDTAGAAAIAASRAAAPVPSPWPATLAKGGRGVMLHVGRPGLPTGPLPGAAFFPYADTVLDNAADQVAEADGSGIYVGLKLSEPDAPLESLPGVLAFEEGGRRVAYEIGVPPAPATSPPPPPAKAAPAPRPADAESVTFWGALGLALLGGVLLNLMPCVFPVLSIKVLALVRQAGSSPGRVRVHGLAYAAGVLSSLLVLAGGLVALKAGGAGVGWGFQLQSPVVVAALAYAMFAMGLGLLGALQIGAGVAGLGDGLARRDGYQGSFFTGALATVVATPCTAPFMGAAVGYALTQPAPVALSVFLALGTGMALPFLALTACPSALRALPRPGPWMETLKRVLSLPLFLTVAWLAWVLSQQVGAKAFWGFAGGFPLLAAILAVRGLSRGGDLASARLGIGAGMAALLVAVLAFDAGAGARVPAGGANWEPFSRVRLNTLRAEGRTVFVDVTAAWCITCQVNDRTTLSSDAVRKAFEQGKVALLKADWTRLEPEIGAFLSENGREGVPLYLLYKGNGEPMVLPQVLTPGTVRDALGTPVAGAAG